MTMHYAQTLQKTHEREFLRYKKITADGRQLELDPRDLYDLLELDKRADRVLPNGLCLLPPRQACERGNACLTCDKFATDATYLAEHIQPPYATPHGDVDDLGCDGGRSDVPTEARLLGPLGGVVRGD